MDAFKNGADALFILLGTIMILAMHAGFAFLESGTVRKKNQINALVKILVDFAISTIAYIFRLHRCIWREFLCGCFDLGIEERL